MRFRNEVRQAGQKWEKGKNSLRTYSHKSDKQHKPNKRHPFPRGPKYECYTPLTRNQAIILKEAFNTEIPIQLPLYLLLEVDYTKPSTANTITTTTTVLEIVGPSRTRSRNSYRLDT